MGAPHHRPASNFSKFSKKSNFSKIGKNRLRDRFWDDLGLKFGFCVKSCIGTSVQTSISSFLENLVFYKFGFGLFFTSDRYFESLFYFWIIFHFKSFTQSPGTSEPPIRPKNLIIRPRKYFLMPRSILMLPGFKIPIKSEKMIDFWKNRFLKNFHFSKIGRNMDLTVEIGIFRREESDFQYPGG